MSDESNVQSTQESETPKAPEETAAEPQAPEATASEGDAPAEQPAEGGDVPAEDTPPSEEPSDGAEGGEPQGDPEDEPAADEEIVQRAAPPTARVPTIPASEAPVEVEPDPGNLATGQSWRFKNPVGKRAKRLAAAEERRAPIEA